MEAEGRDALLVHNVLKAANEAKAACLTKKSPQAPILRIIEKTPKTASSSSKKSAVSISKNDKRSEFFEEQVRACNFVNAFNQHSLFNLKLLLGLIRFCVNASTSVNNESNQVIEIVAVNKSADSFEVWIHNIF
jgi:hypothetical protein